MVIFKCRYWNYCANQMFISKDIKGASLYMQLHARKAEKIMTARLFESDLNQS